MTEQEWVQTALAQLPRPTPPAHLHRRVMAQVRAESQAEASHPQIQVWQKTAGHGWSVEWRQGAPPAKPAAFSSASGVTIAIRRQESQGTISYQHTQKG